MARPSSSGTTDPLRAWFQALESMEEFIGIRFGWLPPGSGTVDWHYLPHSDYDGVGGLAHLMRERGDACPELPELHHGGPPSWGPFIRSLPKLLGPRKRLALKPASQGPLAERTDVPATAVAWHLFDPDHTAALIAASRDAGASVNSYLLWKLDGAIRKALADESLPIPWMIPVNLRGKVTQPSELENHTSYVAIQTRPGDSASGIHQGIHTKLAQGEHWAHWNAYKSGSIVPLKLKQFLLKTDRAVSQWNIGAFSNLGVWNPPGADGPDGAWLFAPLALRSQPLAIGCVTYRHQLSLTIQAHPDLTTDPKVVGQWVEDWVRGITSDFSPAAAQESGASPPASSLPLS